MKIYYLILWISITKYCDKKITYIPVIVDAFLKGVGNFDPDLAYEAKKHSSTSSENSFYIQSAKLNGKDFKTTQINYQEIINGGILELKMGPVPNTKWGLD